MHMTRAYSDVLQPRITAQKRKREKQSHSQKSNDCNYYHEFSYDVVEDNGGTGFMNKAEIKM